MEIMKKDFSTVAKVLAVVALLSIMLGGFLISKRKTQLNEAAKLPFHNVSLTQVDDGTYKARTETTFLHIELAVTVENHKIKDIEVLESEGIDAETAKPILQKMISENKTVVQAVKGAELGSIVYISCVDTALFNGINEQK